MIAAYLEHPAWLPLLAGLLCLAAMLLALGSARARRRSARLLAGPAPGEAWRAAGDVALALALGLLAIALLGPRIGERVLLGATAGADLVILLDASKSMDATDVPPSRLARALASVEQLLPRLASGDRVALAAFAGRGVLFTPLTHDRDAIARMLPALDTSMIQPGGSDLAAGLTEAGTAFDDGSARPRVVLVVSDGEQHGVTPAEGRAVAMRASVRVLALALGSERGALVPGRAGPLLDAAGEPVQSRRDTRGLEELARASDGRVFVADRWGEVDIGALAAAIDRDTGAAGGAPVARRVRVALIQPFAVAAAILLWLEAMPWGGRWRRRAPLAGAALPLLLLPLIGAGGDPEPGARALFLRALQHAESDREATASDDFLAAALLTNDVSLAALAHHNRGVIALRRGELAHARDAFFEAVALRPGDPRARFNLEWTLSVLAEQPQAAASEHDRDKQHERADEAGADSTTDDDTSHRSAEQRDASKQADDAARPEERRGMQGPSEGGSRPPLSAQERAHWLDRVADDPGRSMRATARRTRGDASHEPRRGGPSW